VTIMLLCSGGVKNIFVITGWTDLFHNYYLMGSLMDMGAHALRLLKDAGKLRDLKCFCSDAVQFAQHCGLVSRLLIRFLSWFLSIHLL
jgi:hypothetical protein